MTSAGRRPYRSDRLPGGEHERGEGEVVAVDDPLQLTGAGVELAGEARQGDVDDGDVEVDGEDGGVDGDEDRELADSWRSSVRGRMWTVTTYRVNHGDVNTVNIPVGWPA